MVVDAFDAESPRPATIGARTRATATLRWMDADGEFTGEREVLQIGAIATPRFLTLEQFEAQRGVNGEALLHSVDG